MVHSNDKVIHRQHRKEQTYVKNRNAYKRRRLSGTECSDERRRKGAFSKRDDVEIYGFQDGYKGLIYSNFKMLTSKDFSGILTLGGTILGTSRQPFKLMRVPDKDGIDKVEAMKHTYHKLNLDCLVILGEMEHTNQPIC